MPITVWRVGGTRSNECCCCVVGWLSSGAQVVGVNSSDSFLDSNIMRLYRRVNVFLLQSTSSFDERVFQNSYTVIPGFDARLSNRPFLVFDFRSFGRQSARNLEKLKMVG